MYVIKLMEIQRRESVELIHHRENENNTQLLFFIANDVLFKAGQKTIENKRRVKA